MFDVNSPILDFYPQEFEQDKNGKKADWEAVVKIPFIQEERLLRAMACKWIYIFKISLSNSYRQYSERAPPNRGRTKEKLFWDEH